ncbi:unnamed protein product [Larinioides sclopetarius]|uniref:Uncharacterized protein n=1 Tax=Larinioides sclopetarius TaxID=280406 RepID=A0AAV1ZVI2_9ARAC
MAENSGLTILSGFVTVLRFRQHYASLKRSFGKKSDGLRSSKYGNQLILVVASIVQHKTAYFGELYVPCHVFSRSCGVQPSPCPTCHVTLDPLWSSGSATIIFVHWESKELLPYCSCAL